MKNRICESKQAGRFWVEDANWMGSGGCGIVLEPSRFEGKHYHERDPVIWGPSFGTATGFGRVRIYPGKAMYYVWRNYRAKQLDWNYRRYAKWKADAEHRAKTGYPMPLKADWAKKHAGVFETVEEAIEFANSLMED